MKKIIAIKNIGKIAYKMLYIATVSRGDKLINLHVIKIININNTRITLIIICIPCISKTSKQCAIGLEINFIKMGMESHLAYTPESYHCAPKTKLKINGPAITIAPMGMKPTQNIFLTIDRESLNILSGRDFPYLAISA